MDPPLGVTRYWALTGDTVVKMTLRGPVGILLALSLTGCDDAGRSTLGGTDGLTPRDARAGDGSAGDAGPDGARADAHTRDGPLGADMATDGPSGGDARADATIDDAAVATDAGAADINIDGAADAATDGAADGPPDAGEAGTPDGAPDGPADGAADMPGDALAPDGGALACGTPFLAGVQCPGLCGNNRRDVCNAGLDPQRRPPPFDAGPPPMVAEPCDGVDLAGSTCEQLGFIGGDLVCGENCRFDVRGCDFCQADPRLVACRRASGARIQPLHLSLATTDPLGGGDGGGGDVALAWVVTTEEHGATTFFQTYGAADLAPRDAACVGPGGARGVALAGTGAGYLVATVDPDGIQVRSLDRQGGLVAEGLAVPGRRVALTATSAGTLMVWTADDASSQASLLDDQGAELWRTRLFARELGRASAVETGNGFLVAQRLSGVGDNGVLHNGVAVGRLSAAGVLQGIAYPVPQSTQYPSLAIIRNFVRLTYADFGGDPELHWVSIDANGEARERAQIGDRPWFNPAPIVMFGDETVALVGAFTGTTDHASHLTIARFNAQGDPVGAPLVVNQDPNFSAFWQVTRLGGRMVLAWIESGHGIGLALFRP